MGTIWSERWVRRLRNRHTSSEGRSKVGACVLINEPAAVGGRRPEPIVVSLEVSAEQRITALGAALQNRTWNPDREGFPSVPVVLHGLPEVQIGKATFAGLNGPQVVEATRSGDFGRQFGDYQRILTRLAGDNGLTATLQNSPARLLDQVPQPMMPAGARVLEMNKAGYQLTESPSDWMGLRQQDGEGPLVRFQVHRGPRADFDSYSSAWPNTR